jgi:hypothetical protein
MKSILPEAPAMRPLSTASPLPIDSLPLLTPNFHFK